MNKKLVFDGDSFEDYLYWQIQDRKTLRRVNQLIKDIDRNDHHGIGKPEPLKYENRSYWSRRIDDEHRLVYTIEKNIIHIFSCRFHYGK